MTTSVSRSSAALGPAGAAAAAGLLLPAAVVAASDVTLEVVILRVRLSIER